MTFEMGWLLFLYFDPRQTNFVPINMTGNTRIAMSHSSTIKSKGPIPLITLPHRLTPEVSSQPRNRRCGLCSFTMYIPLFSTTRKRQERRGGGGGGGGGGGVGVGEGEDGGESSGGSSGGKSSGGSGPSTGEIEPYPVPLKSSSVSGKSSASAYGYGGGKSITIPSDQLFAGRSAGGGMRDQIVGSK